MRIGWLALAAIALPSSGAAQQLSVAAARWLTSPHVTDYRVGVQRFNFGPVALAPFGQVALQGRGADAALLVGVGGDAVLHLESAQRLYFVAGVSGGFLDLERTVGVGFWSSWSGGAGFELIRTRPLALGVELRYQSLSRGARGVSLGARLGSPFGRSSTSTPGMPGLPAVATNAAPPVFSPASSATRMQVVDAAIAAMGTPYRWGGSDGNGFDCSGLIHFAYAGVGVDLPRRSVDQARSGRAVPQHVDALAPGDILAFAAAAGGPVTHVGLYVGDGQFIHSASGGVQRSRLALDDAAGRWWLERWVGARRVVADE
jgi:cell wall-associated NlpC family hydrolase